jgi:hypothetical protein
MCSLTVKKLRVIETGEDLGLWTSKLNKQWGKGGKVTVRVSCGGRTLGTLVPQRLNPVCPSLSWETAPIAFDLTSVQSPAPQGTSKKVPPQSQPQSANSSTSSHSSPPPPSVDVAIIEVLNLFPGKTSTPYAVLGIASIDPQSFVASRQSMNQQVTLHVVPSQALTPGETIHSVVDIELSLLAAPSLPDQLSKFGLLSASPSTPALSPLVGSMDSVHGHGGDALSASPGPSPRNADGMANSTDSPVGMGPSTRNTPNIPTVVTGPHLVAIGDVPALETDSLSFSSIDLYFPQYLLDDHSLIVSNVLSMTNVTGRLNKDKKSEVLVKLLCNDGEALKCFPVGGVTIRPNHRAFFSVTFNPRYACGNIPPKLTVTAMATLMPSGKRLPDTRLEVHQAIPVAEQVFQPYHYWVNGNCVCNRPIHVSDVKYIRSVLPIYLMQLDDEKLVVVDKDTGEKTVVTAGGLVASQSSVRDLDPSHSPKTTAKDSSANGSEVQNRSLGGRPTTNSKPIPGKRSVLTVDTKATVGERWEDVDPEGPDDQQYYHDHPVSPTKTTFRSVDVSTAKCLATLNLGVIRGLPPTLRAKPTRFRIATLALDPCWIVQNGESGSLPQDPHGDLYFESTTVVVKKVSGKCSSQFLRFNLIEVIDKDMEIPIGTGRVLLPIPTAVPVSLTFSIAFHIFSSYSRYDDLPSSGVLMRGVRLKIIL